MLFNSFEFLLFFILVFLVYWYPLKTNRRYQNCLVLLASYFFYGWWDWRFLILIVFSSYIDFTIGLLIDKEKDISKRKYFLYLSLLVNIGMLASFKYCNFFIDSFSDLLTVFGMQSNIKSLNLILPVGISFYTFQSLSYTIDIYNNKLKPTKNWVEFFAFVSFFPQLVAGPIERAKDLLPQFQQNRLFDIELAKVGLRLILWGLLKKIVIADNCAVAVDVIFQNHETLSGSILLVGIIYFAFQIYCDFSGYSDIAIGTAKLLGFNLSKNFANPYFATSIRDFWQRWHISLSTWFRDYVYIPLGGSRVSILNHWRNILLTFMISGFWHGANWTFVIWGFLNGFLYLLSSLLPSVQVTIPLRLKQIVQIAVTFFFILNTWIFFRAENLTQALDYFNGMYSYSLFSWPSRYRFQLILIFVFVLIEWLQRKKEYVLDIRNLHMGTRWSIYITILFVILIFGEFSYREFIYFQF